MSVLCDFPEGDYPTAGELHDGVRSRKAGKRLLVKGAPNLLIERCTHVKFRDGTVSKMTGPIRRSIEEKLSEMACRPLRCLALAVKDSNELDPSLREFSPTEEGDVQNHPLLSDSANYRNIESGLTLVGIVGIKDPARPEVADSITECTRAGIRVLMITGDAKDTAVAIARDVNIFPPKDSGKPIKAFEGREFFNKPVKEQLRILAEDNIVFCRAEPVDKQRLVKMLQSLGEIPAMTGDGTFCPLVCICFDPRYCCIHNAFSLVNGARSQQTAGTPWATERREAADITLAIISTIVPRLKKVEEYATCKPLSGSEVATLGNLCYLLRHLGGISGAPYRDASSMGESRY
jgi:hypothetical protein